MKKGVIYKVTNIKNNKVYIGQTSLAISKRKGLHLYEAFHNNSPFLFHRALRKHGKEMFNWDIIWEGEVILLNEKEIYYINKYNSHVSSKCGYNLTIGGNQLNGENNPNIDNTKHNFYHYSGIIELNIRRLDLYTKYNLPKETLINVIHNKDEHSYGWKLTPWKTYNLYHELGDVEFNISRKSFCEKYKFDGRSSIKYLFENKYKSAEGWSYSPFKKYTFYHSSGIIEENVTIKFLIKKYNLIANLSPIITKRVKIYQSWSLYPFELFSFIHESGLKENNVSTFYMCKKYKLPSVSCLVTGRYKTTLGWKLNI